MSVATPVYRFQEESSHTYEPVSGIVVVHLALN
jgi:hypothetical protein